MYLELENHTTVERIELTKVKVTPATARGAPDKNKDRNNNERCLTHELQTQIKHLMNRNILARSSSLGPANCEGVRVGVKGQ